MVTVKDIAKEAGVSYSTVSVAIGRRGTKIPIATATREKVLAAAKKLGYLRNGISDQMRTGRTRTIVFVMGINPQQHLLKILLGVQEEASRQGYFVRICQIGRNAENVYEQMLEVRPDAVIFACEVPRQDELAKMLRNQKIPTASADCKIDSGFDVCIYSDAERGEQEATEYLYRKGIRNFVFVSHNIRQYHYVIPRQTGFERALAKHRLKGIRLDDPDNLPEFLRNFKKIPAGIICSSDFIALKFTIAAFAAGFRVPEDFVIIGFGEMDFQKIVNFPTVSQNFEEIGRMAAEKVIAQIGKERAPEHFTVPTTIIESSSQDLRDIHSSVQNSETAKASV